jgi:hypothetical protein
MTTGRTIVFGCLLAGLWALPAAAEGTQAAAAAPDTSRRVEGAEARADTAARAPVAQAPAGSATGTRAVTASGAARAGSARRLEDIRIEGEIPVPQVLFITARDQRRFMDFHHRRYLRTSQEVGQQTVLPSWIAVSRTRPADTRKETSR